MNRRLLIVAVLVLAVSAIATGAFLNPGPADELGNETGVFLQPADTPNGEEYAEINEDGELFVQLETPSNVVTYVDDVFVIGYNGTENNGQSAEVWVEHDSDILTIVRMDTGEPIEGEGNAVELGFEETVLAGFEIEPDGQDPGTIEENITYKANIPEEPEPPFFDVTIDDATSPVEPGDTVDVDATIENTGDETDTQTIELLDFDGEVVDTVDELTLDPDESEQVSLEWVPDEDDVGTDDVTVSSENDSDTASVTVDAPPEPPFFDVAIDSATSPVEVGDTVDVDATIENTGEQTDTQDTELFDFDGEVVDTIDDLTLNPDESEQVTLDWTPDEDDIGTDDLTVSSENDTDTVSVTVEEPPEPPFFDVTIDSATSPVEPGDTVDVEATIENTGEQTDTQDIELLDFDDEVADTVEDLTLNPDEEEQVTLEWTPDEDDVGTDDVTVTSANDTDTASVIVEAPPEPPFFDVTIDSTTSPVEVGETLEVESTIENTGEQTDTQDIELLDFDDEVADTVDDVTLDPDESEQVSFEWTPDEDDVGTDDVTVSSENDSDTASVTVEAPPEPPFFDVTIDSATSPVEPGDTVDVEATIENTGEQTDSQTIELLDFDSEVADTIDDLTLNPGDNEQVTLEWTPDEDDIGTDDLTVASANDTDTASVTVEEPPEPPFFDVAIDSATSPVEVGEPVDVDATIENTGEQTDTQDIELLDFDDEVADTVADLTLDPDESDQVTLEWTPDEDDVGTDDVTVSSENDTDTASVTVEEPPEPPFFDVTIDSTTSPVEVGETLEVDATIENTGEQTDTQDIELLDFDDEVADTVADLTLDPDDDEQVTLEWTPDEDDVGTDDVTVSSENDTDTASVTVEEPPEPPFFDVTIDSATSPVEPGDTVDVEATVENTGEETDTQDIELLDFDDEVADTVADLTLDPDEIEQVTLEWTPDEDDVGTDDVTVSSQNDTDTTSVTVEEPPEPPFFDVTIDSTTSPVEVGETLEVEATIENTGEQTDTQTIELLDFDDEVVDSVDGLTLEPDESEQIGLEWTPDEDDVGTDDVTVTSANDTDTASVTVEEPPEPPFFAVTIDSATSPVEPGDTVDVEATIENTGEQTDTQDIELLDFDDEVADTVADLTLDPDESEQVGLEWTPDEDDVGTDDVTVTSANDTDTASVTVEDPPEPPFFAVTIDSATSPVEPGDTVDVEATIENTGEETDTQDIELLDFDDEVADTVEDLTLDPDESDQVTLAWTPDADHIGTDNVTVASQNDTDTASVTVEAPPEPPFFAVTIDSTTSPVEVGETLEVDATIENTGEQTDTQDIELLDFDQAVVDTVEDLSLDPDESDQITLVWTPDEDDVGTDNVTVTSENDTDTTSVTVEEPPEPPFFDVTIDSATSPVEPGETVDVEATIENTGEETDTQTIELLDFDDEVVDTVEGLTLDPEESQPVTLTWTPDEDDVGSDTVTVASEDDSDTTTVIVDDDTEAAPPMPPSPEGPFFEVTIDSATSPVESGDTVDVTATIENTGDQADTQPIELLDFDGEVADAVNALSLDPDESEQVDLTWTPGEDDIGTDTITVTSLDDSDTAQITVEEAAPPAPEGPFFEVTIESATSPVEPGDTVDVVATIENTGDQPDSQPIELLDFDNLTVDTVDALSLDPDESEQVELAWTPGEDDIGTDIITVTSLDDFDTTQITVEEPAEPPTPPEEPPEFEVDIINASNPVKVGEEMLVNVSIENIGGQADEQTIELFDFDNETVDDLELALGPGEDEVVQFTWVPDEEDVGTDEIRASSEDDSDTGEVTVEDSGPDLVGLGAFSLPAIGWVLFAVTLTVLVDYLVQTRIRNVVPLLATQEETRNARIRYAVGRLALLWLAVFVLAFTTMWLLFAAGASSWPIFLIILVGSVALGAALGYYLVPDIEGPYVSGASSSAVAAADDDD